MTSFALTALIFVTFAGNAPLANRSESQFPNQSQTHLVRVHRHLPGEGNSAVSPTDHLRWAETLVSELRGVADNHYGGGPRHIDWGPASPSARVVCSSFVSLLLMKSYKLTDESISKMGFGSNPDAANYFDSVGREKGFSHIERITELRPGDFIFVKYTDGHVSRNGVEDTGHVVLIEGAPTPTSEKCPIVNDSTVYTVEIIDSCASGHGPTDTRHLGPNEFTGGVGKGTIRLVAENRNGHLAAYSWSNTKKSEYFGPPAREIKAARLNLEYFDAKSGAALGE